MRFSLVLSAGVLLANVASCGQAGPPAPAPVTTVAPTQATNDTAVASGAATTETTSVLEAVAVSENVGDWPQWRGVQRDGKSLETNLLAKWPTKGPRLVWTFRNTGVGYSGPAVVGDKLYIMGGGKNGEYAFCLNAGTGKKMWESPKLAEEFDNGWGNGPRSTPTVDGDRIYVLTAKGALVCLNAKSGKLVWKKSLTDDFGGNIPDWGYSESPLIDGDRLLCTPGGKNCIVCLNKDSGKTIWQSTGLDDGAQYSSLMPFTVEGLKMYVTQTKGGAVAVAAKDGRFLWRNEETGNGTATIPTPVIFQNYVYTTSGYGTGCGLVEVTVDGDNATAKKIYFNKDMVNHHGGVILVDGCVYGFSDGKGWVCQDLLSGETKWREKGALGKGAITFAEGKFYCFAEKNGTLALIEANNQKWKEISRMPLPEQTKLNRKQGQIWTHPVIADGKLYLRDQDLLFCFDIQGK